MFFKYNVLKAFGGEKMRKHCGPNRGIIALTFALGLLISCFCPPRLLVAVLAIWVIVLAISACKNGR